MQNGIYRGHSINGTFQANVLDVKILAGAGDTWRVFFV